jgi:hypothetical protein
MIGYDFASMSKHLTPIDISKMPDLVRIVEDLKDAKKPRILKKGSAPVAMLMPMKTPVERHNTIETFDFKLLEEVKSELLDACPSRKPEDADILDFYPSHLHPGVRHFHAFHRSSS